MQINYDCIMQFNDSITDTKLLTFNKSKYWPVLFIFLKDIASVQKIKNVIVTDVKSCAYL